MTPRRPDADQAMLPPLSASLTIASTWDGKPVSAGESAEIGIRVDDTGLYVTIAAAFHNDRPPPGRPGPTDRLWEYEVIELFLWGDDNRYLEIEFGPHGHYLVLQLAGIRQITKSHLPMVYQPSIAGFNWSATAHLPAGFLPSHPGRINAHAIHGPAGNRRYLAAFPVPGPQPDFHQPRFAGVITELSRNFNNKN